MIKNKLPVRYTGQHFTIDKVLIDDAIKIAKINESDTVIDIGAGKGFLTVHLVRQCTNLIAIENDKSLLSILKNKFSNNTNVKIIDCDFRCYTIPKRNFKVVSNIPFRITSEILKSLMFDSVEHFMGGSLIMQLEPAQKLFIKIKSLRIAFRSETAARVSSSPCATRRIAVCPATNECFR